MKFYSAKIWILLRLLVLSTILLLHTGKANAAGSKEQRARCDYVEYQRLPLTKKLHGVDGALVIMRDRSILTAEQYSFDDHETSCNARLYLEGSNKKRIETHKMERPIAKIETVNLIGGRPDSFSLTVDYSAGSGSYSGPGTKFFDVVAGRIKWVHAKDEKTRKTEEIHVAQTLKTEWKLFPYGKNQDILEIRCRPAFKNKSDDAFEVTYSRYRFNGHDWIHYIRSEDGFWENEGNFPKESLFPPVRQKN
jgi:hypothetical protein